jgi:micrococcal nuclease
MLPGGPRTLAGGRPRTALVGRLVLIALLVATCAGCRRTSGGPAADAGVGTVVRVVDGDTVDVRVGGRTERVRLIGVDTPESVAHDRPVQCFGTEASAATAALLPAGTEVRLERDEVVRDRYDRLLAYVWRVEDDLLVNLALVEGGFADAVTFGDNEAVFDVLAAAEATARADGVGLWSACGGPDVDVGPPPGP